MGVAFWAVPLLFRHSSKLFSLVRQQSTPALLSTGECELLLCSTRTLLLINPDNATAWNARKRLLSANQSASSPHQMTLSAELSFLSFLFSKHPKSSEAWAHRRWTAQRTMEVADDTGDRGALLTLMRSELSVVEMSAERYPKNYHAWLYRQWMVQQMDGRLSEVESVGKRGWTAVLEEERRRIGEWNESHMSDHSGWHYRSFIVERLLAAHSASLSSSTSHLSTQSSLLSAELSYLSSLQLLYPAHESAWYYRRYLLHSAMQYADSDQERQQLRVSESEWCAERELVGLCSSEAEWQLERRYARLHALYVTELVVRVGGENGGSVEGALRAMKEAEKGRWLSDVVSVQQVYPRQVWVDRMALVTLNRLWQLCG